MAVLVNVVKNGFNEIGAIRAANGASYGLGIVAARASVSEINPIRFAKEFLYCAELVSPKNLVAGRDHFNFG